MRIILYTGKGGVGKTSLSAATAVRSAQLGHKTIVLSTDSAHSLSDSFDREIGYSPVQISENLYAQEINVNVELEKNYQVVQRFLTKYLSRQGFDQVVAEELVIFPGMEELFSLLKVKEYYEKRSYDILIIDCAPTSSTVRMLSFPEAIRWYMTKFFHIERKIMKTIRPIAERIAKIPLPTDDVYYAVEDLYTQIQEMNDILTDNTITTVRLVLNPAKMVIKESQRAYTYLNLFGLSVDLVIANRILPPDMSNTYLEKWLSIQDKYLRVAEECFNPLPIYQARLFDQEMVGMELLNRMAEDIFQDEDPTRIMADGKPIEFIPKLGKYLLRIRFPSLTKEDFDLWVKGDELIVKAGPCKRNILLPRSLASLALKEANYANEYLEVTFGK